jgi:hypothetical protein
MTFFLGTGLGLFSGQAVHFQFAAPDGLDYAVNRYRREAERHYRVLDSQLAGRDYIVGSDYTIVDMSAWGRIDRASRVMKGADDPLTPFPNVKRWFIAIDGRPVVTRARAVGKDHEFKKVNDEEAKRAPFRRTTRDRRLGATRSPPVAIGGMERMTARHFPTPGTKLALGVVCQRGIVRRLRLQVYSCVDQYICRGRLSAVKQGECR